MNIHDIVREVFLLPVFQYQFLPEQARLLLGAWVSERFVDTLTGKDFVLRDYAPPGVRLPIELQHHQGVLTVLTSDVKSLRDREDYKIYATFPVQPKRCPLDDHNFCPLCEGAHVVVWDDEWRIVVLVPNARGN